MLCVLLHGIVLASECERHAFLSISFSVIVLSRCLVRPLKCVCNFTIRIKYVHLGRNVFEMLWNLLGYLRYSGRLHFQRNGVVSV